MNFKRCYGSLLLALLLMLGLSACVPENEEPVQSTPALTTAPTTVDTETEEPSMASTEPDLDVFTEVTQLRVHDVKANWMNVFETGDGAFFVATNVQMLMEGLSRRGIDPSGLDLSAYNSAFFAANRLVIIPRSSSSGSVRYSARMDRKDGGVKITLIGKMPQIGTADMADWLVLVPLDLRTYPGKITVENVRSAPVDGQRYTAYRY